MKECSKSILRRLADSNFSNRYFVGDGLDIGGKPDPLALYEELFPLMGSVRTWDLEDGDAQLLESVADCSFDFVHSSHCLEHLFDPREGLANWLRVTRPGGYIIITVPDEDLYEQGVFPSTYNADHKWTFTIFKHKSWSSKSLNLIDMVREADATAELVRLEQLSSTYRFKLPRYDQTMTPICESAIECVFRKRPDAEIEAGGRWQRNEIQPSEEMRVHLNQYRHDKIVQRAANASRPPFSDASDV